MQLAPVDYDPNGKCPVFLGYLNKILLGNTGVVAFMHRLLGYSITGDVSEHILAILNGDGRNGKSTLTTLMMGLLGDYACKAPEGLLETRKFNAHPTELAKLFGKRFVLVSETEERTELNESRVKDLTGGDPIAARGMFENWWDFMPTHKFFICTNHKPIVKGGHAIWSRIRLVLFGLRFWRRGKALAGLQDKQTELLEAQKDIQTGMAKSLETLVSKPNAGGVKVVETLF